jgi:hypothetical protein
MDKISIIIDSTILTEAQANISDIPSLSRRSDIKQFKTHFSYSRIEAGKTVFSLDSTEVMSGIYFWKNDSLILDIGPDSWYESVLIVFHKANKHPYYIQTHHDNDAEFYKLKSSDTTVNNLYVPFDSLQMIVSSLPKKGQMQSIYGYVSFKTKNYHFDNSKYPDSNKDKYTVSVAGRFFFKADYLP